MTIEISRLSAPFSADSVAELSTLIAATVNGGAAISFMQPYTPAMGERFWRDAVEPNVTTGTAMLFVARNAGRIVGTVQLWVKMPPNQPHRAEIAKMMVHPDARRLGIGRALMLAAVDEARRLGKSLVTLDTRTGDNAERLYAGIGFQAAGIIPDFALDPDGGATHGTTYMYLKIQNT